MAIINFKCKKCSKEFCCDVREVYFPSNINDKLSFEKKIICPNCNEISVEKVELTE